MGIATLRGCARHDLLAPAAVSAETLRLGVGAVYSAASYFGLRRPPERSVLTAGRSLSPLRVVSLVAAAAGRRSLASVLVGAGALAAIVDALSAAGVGIAGGKLAGAGFSGNDSGELSWLGCGRLAMPGIGTGRRGRGLCPGRSGSCDDRPGDRPGGAAAADDPTGDRRAGGDRVRCRRGAVPSSDAARDGREARGLGAGQRHGGGRPLHAGQPRDADDDGRGGPLHAVPSGSTSASCGARSPTFARRSSSTRPRRGPSSSTRARWGPICGRSAGGGAGRSPAGGRRRSRSRWTGSARRRSGGPAVAGERAGGSADFDRRRAADLPSAPARRGRDARGVRSDRDGRPAGGSRPVEKGPDEHGRATRRRRVVARVVRPHARCDERSPPAGRSGSGRWARASRPRCGSCR